MGTNNLVTHDGYTLSCTQGEIFAYSVPNTTDLADVATDLKKNIMDAHWSCMYCGSHESDPDPSDLKLRDGHAYGLFERSKGVDLLEVVIYPQGILPTEVRARLTGSYSSATSQVEHFFQQSHTATATVILSHNYYKDS